MASYMATYAVPIFFTVEAGDEEEAREKADEHIEKVLQRITGPDRMGPSFDTTDHKLIELIDTEEI